MKELLCGLEFQVRGNDNGCESIHNEEARDGTSRASLRVEVSSGVYLARTR